MIVEITPSLAKEVVERGLWGSEESLMMMKSMGFYWNKETNSCVQYGKF